MSWGVYDGNDEETGRTMDPATHAACLAEALGRCDDFVWLFFEGQNLLTGEASEWRRAIVKGREAGLSRRDQVRQALKAKLKAADLTDPAPRREPRSHGSPP